MRAPVRCTRRLRYFLLVAPIFSGRERKQCDSAGQDLQTFAGYHRISVFRYNTAFGTRLSAMIRKRALDTCSCGLGKCAKRTKERLPGRRSRELQNQLLQAIFPTDYEYVPFAEAQKGARPLRKAGLFSRSKRFRKLRSANASACLHDREATSARNTATYTRQCT